jgi:hypothetical protein
MTQKIIRVGLNPSNRFTNNQNEELEIEGIFDLPYDLVSEYVTLNDDDPEDKYAREDWYFALCEELCKAFNQKLKKRYYPMVNLNHIDIHVSLPGFNDRFQLICYFESHGQEDFCRITPLPEILESYDELRKILEQEAPIMDNLMSQIIGDIAYSMLDCYREENDVERFMNDGMEEQLREVVIDNQRNGGPLKDALALVYLQVKQHYGWTDADILDENNQTSLGEVESFWY